MSGIYLPEHPVHLGLGATAENEPAFTGDLSWYASYTKRHEADGIDARLVSMHSSSEPWDVWEMHPNGSEVAPDATGCSYVDPSLVSHLGRSR
jgi:hypothetical protein